MIAPSASGDPPPVSERSAALHRSLVRSIAWVSVARWSSQVATWAITLIVARLLSPEDYGVVGMATVYYGVVSLLNEFGLGASVVIVRDIQRDQVAQINGLALLVGAFSFGMSWLLAPPIGAFFDAPEVTEVIRVLSGAFVLTAFGTVPLGALEKALRYKRIAVIQATRAVIAALGTLVLAAAGYGYWALVASFLIQAVVGSALAVAFAPQPFAWPRLRDIRRVATIGFDIMGGRFAWYVYSNADYLVAGKLLGKGALGAYTFAFTLASIPVDKITAMVSQVLTGYFSSVQDDRNALRRMVLGLTEGLSLVTFPLTLGLALTARDLIPVLLGDKWVGAIAPLEILAGYSAVRAVTPVLNPVLSVTGQTRYGLWVTVLAAVILPVGFVVGSRWGTVGIATVWLILHPITIWMVYVRVAKTIELTAAAYLRSVWPALSSALVMAGVVIGLRFALAAGPSGLRLVLEIVVGALAYVATFWLGHRSRVGPALSTLRQLRK